MSVGKADVLPQRIFHVIQNCLRCLTALQLPEVRARGMPVRPAMG